MIKKKSRGQKRKSDGKSDIPKKKRKTLSKKLCVKQSIKHFGHDY